MTTRRRALFGFAASIGTLGAVGGLATAASAVRLPAPAPPPLDRALAALRVENEQLHAESEQLRTTIAHHERAMDILWSAIRHRDRKIERLEVEQEILLRHVNPVDWPFKGVIERFGLT